MYSWEGCDKKTEVDAKLKEKLEVGFEKGLHLRQ